MYNYTKEIDCIDSMVINSDWLLDRDNLEFFRNFLKRWQNQCVVFEKRLDEIDRNNCEHDNISKAYNQFPYGDSFERCDDCGKLIRYLKNEN